MGLGGFTVAHGGDPRAVLLPDMQQEVLAARARELATRPFVVQAANGAVLDQTVWGYHFVVESPAELHASGMALLDRLARRQLDEGHGGCLRLYVQRAQDRPPAVSVRQMAARRGKIDQDRLAAITTYLAEAWPQVPFTVQLYDPHPIGMPALEAAPALTRHQGTALGYIPADFRAVQSSSKTEGGGAPQGGFLKPEAVSQPGAGGASSIGASEGVVAPVAPGDVTPPP
jgi:hypothetical protein